MRKAIAGAAAVVVFLGSGAVPAGAVSNAALNRRVTGAFTGTNAYAFSMFGCEYAYHVYNGAYVTDASAKTANPRTGTFSITGCVDRPTPTASYTFHGRFELKTPGGAVLRGRARSGDETPTVDNCGGYNDGPINFTLRVRHGTKAFRHARGTLHLLGTFCAAPEQFFSGPIYGQLTGNVRQ
jgi:hypothetical protein